MKKVENTALTLPRARSAYSFQEETGLLSH